VRAQAVAAGGTREKYVKPYVTYGWSARRDRSPLEAPQPNKETTMKTHSKLFLAALALATLLPTGSVIVSTDAGAYPRWGHWTQHWYNRVPTQSVGSKAIRAAYGNGKPCGLTMHVGSDGNCYIN
jgi:hypothetical protein